MTDIFTRKKRSEIMSHIRSENTQTEKIVFSFLRRRGIHFQKHYKKIAGSPDIALPKKKRAVFIDGDFWHGWKQKQSVKRLPDAFWKGKILSNIKRDKKNRAKLRRGGWKVLRVWQHEIEKNTNKTLNKISEFLTLSD